MHEALYNWGNAFLNQAKQKSGAERETFLQRAEEVLGRAAIIDAGETAYNLACLFGIRGDEENCRKQMELSYDSGKLPDKQHILSDEDLIGMREKQWFKELIEKAKSK